MGENPGASCRNNVFGPFWTLSQETKIEFLLGFSVGNGVSEVLKKWPKKNCFLVNNRSKRPPKTELLAGDREK